MEVWPVGRQPYSLVRPVLRLTRRLERAALRTPPPAVAATLQDQRYFTDRTREVYTALERGVPPIVSPFNEPHLS